MCIGYGTLLSCTIRCRARGPARALGRLSGPGQQGRVAHRSQMSPRSGEEFLFEKNPDLVEPALNQEEVSVGYEIAQQN